MAIYEITSHIIHIIRHGRNRELPGLVPLMTYTVLAPFIGAEAACDFVDRRACAGAGKHGLLLGGLHTQGTASS
jgi:hypothetical protein